MTTTRAEGTGELSLLLHAHLPYVRHPEHESHLEEHWLFGALIECYLPLLSAFESLVDLGLGRTLTMSVSPTLLAMLRDPLLLKRFDRHLHDLTTFVSGEAMRAQKTRLFSAVRFHEARLDTIRATWSAIDCDVPSALAHYEQRGLIELATTPATHAFLPMFEGAPQIWNAQIATAVRIHREVFGRPPRVFWLPECGYADGIDRALLAHGIRATVVETHGLLLAQPRPPHGPYAPVVTPAGLIVAGRDPASSRQVWSRAEGYPGHADYREYHRDLAFATPIDRLGPLAPAGDRVQLGIKPWRITGPSEEKEPYDAERAEERARTHARDFVARKEAQVDALGGAISSPLLVAPFDAELFGHWWFEGPTFLREVLLAAHRSPTLRAVAFGDAVCGRDVAECEIAPSSWGQGGYGGPWLGHAAAAFFLPLRTQAEDLKHLVQTFENNHDFFVQRALRRACREVLLTEASDFQFLLHFEQNAGYARRRLETHLQEYARLAAALRDGTHARGLDDSEPYDTLAAGIRPSDFSGAREGET